MMKGPFLRHLVVGLMAAFAGPAFAAPAPTSGNRTDAPAIAAVAYGDIDFRRADAGRILDSRIAAAIDSLCGPADLDAPIESRQCRDRARANAEPSRRILMQRAAQRSASR
jgi:UrcA family protein